MESTGTGRNCRPCQSGLAGAHDFGAVLDKVAKDAVRRRICMITRLRLDARLFDPPARRQLGTIGRPRVIGRGQPTLAERLRNPRTRWRRLRVTGWYGRGERDVE